MCLGFFDCGIEGEDAWVREGVQAGEENDGFNWMLQVRWICEGVKSVDCSGDFICSISMLVVS